MVSNILCFIIGGSIGMILACIVIGGTRNEK